MTVTRCKKPVDLLYTDGIKRKDCQDVSSSPEYRLMEDITNTLLTVKKDEFLTLHQLVEKILDVVIGQQKTVTSLEEDFWEKFQLQQIELQQLKEGMQSQCQTSPDWIKDLNPELQG